jgi:hypothetical protein
VATILSCRNRKLTSPILGDKLTFDGMTFSDPRGRSAYAIVNIQTSAIVLFVKVHTSRPANEGDPGFPAHAPGMAHR